MRVRLIGTIVGVYGKHINPGPGTILDLPLEWAHKHIDLGNAVAAEEDQDQAVKAAVRRGPGRPPKAT
jgi:hypothetical protein